MSSWPALYHKTTQEQENERQNENWHRAPAHKAHIPLYYKSQENIQ